MTIVTAAQGARSQLLVKKQSAIGTAATGNFNRLRYNSHSINPRIATTEGEEIRFDRQVQDLRHGNRSAQGDIAVDLTYGDHDLLLESALFGVFTTDTLLLGTSPQYLTLEDGALDISEYRRMVDAQVNTMRISIRPEPAIIKATFGLIGTNVENNTSVTAGGTPVAASENQPFDSFNGAIFDNAAESGVELAIITGIDINVDNGIRPGFAVGQQTAAVMEYGRGRVTGQLTAYYTDETWLNRFLNEEEFALSINLVDPDGNDIEFRLPRVKLTDGGVPVQNEQSRIITMPFAALRDATLGTALRIMKG